MPYHLTSLDLSFLSCPIGHLHTPPYVFSTHLFTSDIAGNHLCTGVAGSTSPQPHLTGPFCGGFSAAGCPRPAQGNQTPTGHHCSVGSWGWRTSLPTVLTAPLHPWISSPLHISVFSGPPPVPCGCFPQQTIHSQTRDGPGGKSRVRDGCQRSRAQEDGTRRRQGTGTGLGHFRVGLWLPEYPRH